MARPPTLIATEETQPNCLKGLYSNKCLPKYTLLILTLAIAFCNFLVISLNDDILVQQRLQYKKLLIDDQLSFNIDLYPMICGIAVCIQAFGIFAITKESVTCLKWYGILLFITFASHFVMGAIILSILYNESSIAPLKFYELMQDYETDTDARITLDAIQEASTCCGYDQPDDWASFLKSNIGAGDNQANILTPDSCCKNSQFGEKCNAASGYGCQISFLLLFGFLEQLIMLESSVLCILTLLAVMLVSNLRKKIKEINDYSRIRQELLNGSSTSSSAIRHPFVHSITANEK